MAINRDLRQASCPCTKLNCARWGQCDICRENHYDKGKKPYCERKRYLKKRGVIMITAAGSYRIENGYLKVGPDKTEELKNVG